MDGELERADVVHLVRLLGEVSGSELSLNDRRKMLLNGLASLVGADVWVWSLMGEIDPSAPPTHTVFLHGGFRDNQLDQYLKIQEHPDLQWMTEPFMSALLTTSNHVTRVKEQMVSDEELNASSIAPQLIEADLDGIILSGRTTRQGQVSVISLFRSVGRRQFSLRDARLTHIVLSEVDWLHETAFPNHPREGISALSPRQRTVLGFLLQGYQRKEIAKKIDLSVHTVNDYIKEVYAVLGVHSHTELFHRFYRGDQGDLVIPGTYY
ncbi:MAG: LuxR C-terminal-related transcriptional regulator [Verrucomicrobiales bacterium]|nr:LuxR C-terminal-related transcriptional regulator [Verrucomicrobiales bacterium]